MSENALAIYGQFDVMARAATVLAKSGFFKDVQSEAQAIVKVLAGAELGLPPFASMTGISIIQGKPVLGANLIATLVKNDPRYDYRPVEHTDTACVIEWKENGKIVGESSFNWDEAQRAGLTGKDNWRKYPSDMLFARAISRGARRFAPGIFGGSPIYTPDELGADVDADGNVLEGEIIAQQRPAPQQNVTHPITNGKQPPSNEATIRNQANAAGISWEELNDRPVPIDNLKWEQWRGILEKNKKPTVTTVCSCVVNTGAYRSEGDALAAALELYPDAEKGTSLTTSQALKLFDDLYGVYGDASPRSVIDEDGHPLNFGDN